MIAYLAGTVTARTDKDCVVVTPGGVGYAVSLTTPGAASLPADGEQVELYVATIVREDALELYGFTSWDERATFLLLLSISKLGPKTALGILSCFSPDDLRGLVLRDDPTALIQVSGIGKKSAQRIFVELKYKMDMGGPAASLPSLDGKAVGVFRDALAGLSNLGYDESEARTVLEKVFGDEPDMDVTEALRAALKTMARSRN